MEPRCHDCHVVTIVIKFFDSQGLSLCALCDGEKIVLQEKIKKLGKIREPQTDMLTFAVSN